MKIKPGKTFSAITGKGRWGGFASFICLLLTLHFSLLTFSYAESPERIVSLAPSVTEILFAAGMGDRIAGVTTFCDFPEEAKGKTKIGGMSNPSLEAVVSLRPDLVIMTTDGNPKEFQLKLHGLHIKTHVFESLRLSELPEGIRKMGMVLEEPERFNSLAGDIEQRMQRLTRAPGAERKKILYIVWPEPLIVAGPKTAVDDALSLLGAVNLAGMAQGRYPKYSLEEIFRQSPDIIFIGKGMQEDMRKMSRGLLQRLSTVPAVKEGHVFFVSDQLYRLGPRAVSGVEELARYLEEEQPAGE